MARADCSLAYQTQASRVANRDPRGDARDGRGALPDRRDHGAASS